MFENIMNFLKKITKKEEQTVKSKDAAKERLHLVFMQDIANVSADFLDLMKKEIIEVIKKYIDIDESAMDVRLTNKENSDGTNGAPALYANIPIVSIKDENKNAINAEAKEKREEKEEHENTTIEKQEAQEKEVEETKEEQEAEQNVQKENK